jgi:hypothetical protein
MLERFITLMQCEAFLAEKLCQCHLICDLPLSPQDIDKLIALVQDIPKHESLLAIAPNVLACTLVFAVYQCEVEADYWPKVSKLFKIEQERLRSFFDDYLLDSPLVSLDKHRNHIHDIPMIFVHAGIQPRHLDEFLAKFVKPLVNETRATTLEAVKSELTTIRQEAARPQRIQKRVPSIKEMDFARTDLPAPIKQLQAIEAYLALEAEAAGDFGSEYIFLGAQIERPLRGDGF